jgi:outer membrane protein assembly factor BamA
MTDIERPEPSYGRAALNVAASTQGSYAFILDGQLPAYWDGWRVGLTLSLIRGNRLGYYGQGNDTPYDSDSTTGRSYFYMVSRTTAAARATVQRRVVGRLRALVGATIDRTDFRELPGESVFQRDRAAGVVTPNEDQFSDLVGRVGLVFDSRDLEADPHGGVFAEALVSFGSGYTRTTGGMRAYVHPLRRLVVAGRLGAESMTGTPPLSAQMTMESSEGPFVAMGGRRSLRGYHDGRYIGPGKLVASVEARYGVLWSPRLMELKLFAFYDVGRVFGPGEPIRLTRDGLHRAGGGGLALSLMRNTLVTLVAGWGTEGGQVTFGTTWSY